MTRSRLQFRFLLLLCAVALAVGVASCGKKDAPRPPEGEEGAYTYPRVYPNPTEVLPFEPEAEAPDEPADSSGTR